MKERLRMCIACRQYYDKQNLIRIVKSSTNEILIDKTGKKNGRGAYVCCAECLHKCKKQRLLNKAFKSNVPEEIYQKLLEDF